jgi:hypothetical protein
MRLGMGLGLGNLLSGGPITGMSNKYSFNFDGSNDYLDTGKSFESTLKNSFTLSAWIKPTDGQPSAKGSICGTLKYDNYSGYVQFSQETNGKLKLTIGTPTAEQMIGTSSVVFSDGASDWTHVVAVFTKSSATTGTIVLYANGSDVSDTTTKDGSWNIESYVNSYDMFIGARNQTGTANQFLNGLIDEVGIWNTALSADDVAKIASKPLNLSKASTYATDRTANLKLWLRAGDKALPEEDASIARSDFYTDFDGTDDYVSIADTDSLSFGDGSNDLPFSISGWIYPTDATNWVIFQKGVDFASSEYGFYMDADDKLAIHTIDTNYGSSSGLLGRKYSTAMTQNVWSHVVATYDGSKANSGLKLYLNGKQVDDTDAGGGSYTAMGNKAVASQIAGRDSVYSEGYISSVSVYKTTLDAQTIKQFAKSRFTPMRDNRFSVVDFDGSNDIINCGSDSSLDNIWNGGGTLTAWIFPKSDGEGNDGRIAEKRDDGSGWTFVVREESSGSCKIRLFVNYSTTNGIYTTNADVTINEWNHVAVTYDTSGAGSSYRPTIYVNGVVSSLSATTDSAGTADSDASEDFTIGGNKTPLDRCFDGSISSVSIYNTAKSAEEIYAIYQQGITYDESSLSGLVGYWRMGDDTSKAYPTIADSSSNSNDGTITNGASNDIVQQMVAGWDMGAFESSSEEVGGSLITTPNSASAWGANQASKDDATVDGRSGVRAEETSTGDRGRIDRTLSIDNNVPYQLSGYVYKYSSYNGNSATNKNWHLVFGTDGSNFYLLPSERINSHIGTMIFSDIALKKVLQSEVSDTYPAIIDVNEPVLGAELTSFNSITGTGNSFTNDILTFAVDGYGFFNISGFSVSTLYKLTYTIATQTASGLAHSGGSSAFSGSIPDSVGSHTQYLLSGTGSSSNLLTFRSTGFRGTITDIVLKEIQGNVGTMTNQASSDLVYSSVLPDQSFLTGVNSAYNFIDLGGTDEYVSVDGIVSDMATQTGTINLWVMPTSDTGNTVAVFTYNDNNARSDMMFRYNWANNRLEAGLAQGGSQKWETYTATNSVSSHIDSWNMITLVHDGSDPICYINGVDAEWTVVNSSDKTFWLGDMSGVDKSSLGIWNYTSLSNVFIGKIGQSAVWNKNLSASEISAIYNLGRHGNLSDKYSEGLKGYWAMGALDASTGLSDVGNGTIYDRSGNSNHGTGTNTESADLASSPNADPNGYSKGETNRSTDVK